MVDGASANVCGHCVLKRQTNELIAVRPPENFGEELADPSDYSALTSAWQSMDELKQRIVVGRLYNARALFKPFVLHSGRNVRKNCALLLIRAESLEGQALRSGRRRTECIQCRFTFKWLPANSHELVSSS